MSEIETVADREHLDELVASSHERPVMFFKHSLRCGASFVALEELVGHVAEERHEAIRYAVIEIQGAPELSREVERLTGVRHQSPQVMLVYRGDVLWHASHGRITRGELAQASSRAPSAV